MSRLEELQRELQDASAAIVRAERTLAAHPDIPSVAATLRSITKRREGLEEQFLAAVAELGLDVCSYRIDLPNTTRPTIAGMAAVLGEFQKVFTSVYHALKNGPKLTAKVSSETVKATSLGFAYAFPGSVGIMMTIENDEGLALYKTDLDEAMENTLELLGANRSQELQELSEKVGLPALRHAHQWAVANIEAGFGANIAWKLKEDNLEGERSIVIQPPEIKRLEQTIRRVTAREEITIIGDLVEVNVTDRTFQISARDQVIHGSFTGAITATNPAQLPKQYRAILRVSEPVVTEAGQEEKTYFLLRLEPVDESSALLSDFSSE